MNTYNRRVMEMLERVHQYGRKPELTLTAIITALLAAVNVNLLAMRDWMAGQTNGQGTYRGGASERRSLIREIYTVLRDMREIAKALELGGVAGVANHFRLPARFSFANTVATARSFVQNATPMETAFTDRGMPATFIADLQAKIAAFDVATGGKHDGKADQVGSTAALKAAGKSGLIAVQQLRAIMRVHLRGAPELLAAWVSVSRVDRGVRRVAPRSTPIAPSPNGA